jgi:hypothetical protein
MRAENRIALNAFPEDWRYYTLAYPVARYKRLSLNDSIHEMVSCNQSFYSIPRILRRLCANLGQRREPLISLVGNLSFRSNTRSARDTYEEFKCQHGGRFRHL